MSKFIVLSSGRSGSTMLVNYLASHPDVVCYHEPFTQNNWHPDVEKYNSVVDAIDHIFKRGLSVSGVDKAKIFLKKHLNLSGLRPTGLGKSNQHSDATGFKITWAQWKTIEADFDQWLAANADTKIILLNRSNLMERFVSYKVAETRGIWHSSRDKDEIEPRIEVDVEEYRGFVETERSERDQILEQISKYGSEVHGISYEALCADPDEKMAEMFRFLGVAPAEETFCGTRKLVQGSVEEIITNYADIPEELRNAKSM